MTLSMNLQKPDAFLPYKACIFEKKPYIFCTVTKKIPIQFVFLSKTILYQFCAINSFNFQLRRLHYPVRYTSLYFIYNHQRKARVNKVVSFLKQCLQLALFIIYFLVYRIYTYCSLRCVQLHVHAQAHSQVSLRVQFIARAKSQYFHLGEIFH